MDKNSQAVYQKMGFTHFVTIPSSDPRQPDGYKAVKAGDRQGVFVDENGTEYSPKPESLTAFDSPAPTVRKKDG